MAAKRRREDWPWKEIEVWKSEDVEAKLKTENNPSKDVEAREWELKSEGCGFNL